MPSSAPQRGESVDLLGRIYHARDLPEALSLLFDAVLSPAGIKSALVLVEVRGELRGVVGMGWPEEEARSVVVPLDDLSHPLVATFYSTDPAIVELGRPTEAGIRGSYAALPISSGHRDRNPFGILLVGPGVEDLERFNCLLDRLNPFGPVLQTIADREQLSRSNQQLEQQRDLLNSIINALPDPVLITDAANSILLENRRAESLFTTGESDSEGRRRAVEINNLLFSSFLTRSIITGSEGTARELNLVDPTEGGDLLFEVLSTPLPPALAGEKSTVSVLRDVTDLKRATTELEAQFKRLRQAELKARRERDRLNMILENVGDPILVTDDQSNIILLNREAERLFEVPGATPLNARRRQDVRANDTKFSSFISDFALSADHVRIAEFALNEPDTGREFPAEMVSGKVKNERAEMAAIVSVLHDLTKVVENERLATELGKLNENLEDRVRSATEELEERNRQLEWQSRELERAYRLKSQFLASMSHELRTPINALVGYTALMRDRIYGDLNQRQQEALARMYTASKHLLELVNDILDLAKIEAGKMPVHVEPVDVADLVHELSQTIEPMVRRKQLEYRVELADGLPVLETDRTKVKQIVLNLLSNAVKFTRQGHIGMLVRPSSSGDGIVVEVTDSGIGITEEDVPKIFEDFRQVDQSSTREYGGTGLGLSITKKLLHLLGGTVSVSSSPGKGSTFTVFLPRRSEEIYLDEEVARMARAADDAVLDSSVDSG